MDTYGQTAMKTQNVINKALGGILFIDEAYSLCSDDNYSRECIATLIKAMEDHRDNLCVIMAGYSKEMEELINSNRGFQSRIQFYLDFDNYSADELFTIIEQMVEKEHYILGKRCKDVILDFFNTEIKSNKDNFSNGRCARNLFEKVKMEQATRVIDTKSKDVDVITADDITAVIEKIKTKPCKSTIGFIT